MTFFILDYFKLVFHHYKMFCSFLISLFLIGFVTNNLLMAVKFLVGESFTIHLKPKEIIELLHFEGRQGSILYIVFFYCLR